MSYTHIHIDRIALKLQGVDPAIAQSFAQSLGPALLQSLAQQPELLRQLQKDQPLQLRNLNLTNLQISPNQDSKAINQAVVQATISALAGVKANAALSPPTTSSRRSPQP
jgi:hypothetical protein